MCGQWGLITGSKFLANGDKFIRDAFVASMLRGEDSSGIATINTKSDSHTMHKLPIAGHFFSSDKIARQLISSSMASEMVTMCHVRAATVGKINYSNSHPFVVYKGQEVLVGTHNGTLYGWESKPGGKNFDVDSEWAMHTLMHDKLDAFEHFKGAYSLVWWRSDDAKVLNMARNDSRPMAVVFLDNGGMAYASEPGMLFWLLERNDIKMNSKVMLLDAGKQYKFDVSDPSNFSTYLLPKPAESAVTELVPVNTGNKYFYEDNNMSKVKELIERVSKAAGSKVEVEQTKQLVKTKNKVTKLNSKNNKASAVLPEERKMAREHGWDSAIVDFVPITVNSLGETVGICEGFNTQFDAIIRYDTSALDSDTIWRCKVLGMTRDKNGQLNMILGEPVTITVN